MAVELVYKCECRYYHKDDDTIQLLHMCTDHKIELVHDALANLSKRIKLGTSGPIHDRKEYIPTSEQ